MLFRSSAILQGLANAGSRERWNRGCASGTGEQILSDEEIAELQPAGENTPEPEPVAPAARSTVVRRQVRQPQTTQPQQAIQPAEEPEPNRENSDQDSLQAELV